MQPNSNMLFDNTDKQGLTVLNVSYVDRVIQTPMNRRPNYKNDLKCTWNVKSFASNIKTVRKSCYHVATLAVAVSETTTTRTHSSHVNNNSYNYNISSNRCSIWDHVPCLKRTSMEQLHSTSIINIFFSRAGRCHSAIGIWDGKSSAQEG